MTDHTKLFPFESVLIYGMGMMGASLGWAIKEISAGCTITGIVRTDKSAAYIRNYGLADRVIIQPEISDCKKLDLNSYDLIVLGLPVRSVVQLIPVLPSCDSIITDMSSTRREVHACALKRSDLSFVGSHPICGSEDTGPSAFKEDLFKDRLCILTPGYLSDINNIDHDRQLTDAHRTEEFWRRLGMKTYFLDSDSHDELLSYLSHAPHVISSILAIWAQKNSVVKNSMIDSPLPITGGGFKDMARIAGSNPEMWSDILMSNKDYLIESLENYVKETNDVIDLIRSSTIDEWLAWFASARRARNRLCGYSEDR